MSLGVYVHVPFCDRLCIYCDFAKEIANDEKKVAYVEALEKESRYYDAAFKHATTLYLGGGTPTVLPIPLLKRLIQHLAQWIDIDQLEEFTIEANPNDITPELVHMLVAQGVNRISLGVQTFHNHHLKFLNRTHQTHHIKQALSTLREGGLSNINLDMMFALPYQTLEELKEDLNHVIALEVPHISYYSLILEEKTPLYSKVLKGQVAMLEEHLEAQMFEEVIQTLRAKGYDHYEISNYAHRDKQSKHNRIYWENQPYVGLGPSAHGRLGATRYGNQRSIKKYIEQINQQGHAQNERYAFNDLADTMMMGLRLREGINLNHLETRLNKNVFACYPKLQTFIDQGLLSYQQGQLALTDRGLFLGNEVFEMFVGDADD